MKKSITIKWDEHSIEEAHTENALTNELIGVLEFVKLTFWENKRLIKDDEEDN